MIVFDERLRILSCSRAAQDMFGLSHVEMAARNVGDLLVTGIHSALADAGDRPSAGWRIMGRHRDGSTFPLEIAVDQMDGGGAFIAFVRPFAQRGTVSIGSGGTDGVAARTVCADPPVGPARREPAPRPGAHPADGRGSRPAAGRWCVRPLAWDMALPERADGFALLVATRPVRLAHHKREAGLRVGDLALIDRRVPFSLAGEDGWTANLLELGSRGFGGHADLHAYRVGQTLDGTAPLATSIKSLWAIGQQMDRLALADDVNRDRMIDLIGGLARRLASSGPVGGTTSHQAAMIERAELVITARLAEPGFSAATLAAAMGVSPRHLSSLFAAVGTTPSKAIVRHRMSHAKSLLGDPANRQRQIAWVARSSGFEDQNYFSRCFRREEKMTPREFRDRNNSIKRNDR